MTTVIRGLTWDHPRAWQGLLSVTERFNRSQSDIQLQWDKHSLRGFEATPIEQLAARYDLITFDHPFVGDAVKAACLVDLKKYADSLRLEEIASDSAGPSYSTYSYGQGQWALPIDAACQAAAARPDLMERLGADVPVTLEDAVRFGERHGLGLALAVPHAFMNYLTICSLLGAEISGEGDTLIEPSIATEALELHRHLSVSAPHAARGWSSIGLLQAMATTDEIAWSPMVFCFNTYSRPDRAHELRKLSFHDVPGLSEAKHGPVIGGAGLAISVASAAPRAAVTALAHLLERETQLELARTGGQPGRNSAWNDSSADAANGGFFTGSRKSLLKSAIRPRYPGYMALQEHAGRILLEDVLGPGRSARDVVSEIERAHRAAREGRRAQH